MVVFVVVDTVVVVYHLILYTDIFDVAPGGFVVGSFNDTDGVERVDSVVMDMNVSYIEKDTNSHQAGNTHTHAFGSSN